MQDSDRFFCTHSTGSVGTTDIFHIPWNQYVNVIQRLFERPSTSYRFIKNNIPFRYDSGYESDGDTCKPAIGEQLDELVGEKVISAFHQVKGFKQVGIP